MLASEFILHDSPKFSPKQPLENKKKKQIKEETGTPASKKIKKKKIAMNEDEKSIDLRKPKKIKTKLPRDLSQDNIKYESRNVSSNKPLVTPLKSARIQESKPLSEPRQIKKVALKPRDSSAGTTQDDRDKLRKLQAKMLQ